MSAETERMCRTRSGFGGTPFPAFSQPDHDYAEQMVFSMAGVVDVDAFRAAWRALIERHAVLRASPGFANPSATGQPEVPMRVEDWRDEPQESSRDERLERLLESERMAGFDRDAPPFRVQLLRWNGGGDRIVWTFRRALLDWRSISVLLRELFACYYSALHGADPPPALPALNGQLAAGNAVPAVTETAFWREYLDEYAGPRELDLPRPREMTNRAGSDEVVEKHVDLARSDSIRRLGRTADVTMHSLAEAAWALLLSRYSGADDVCFGIVRSCRRSGPPGLQDSLGAFTNVVPLRVRADEERNVFELLWHVRDQHRKVRAHECSDLVEVQRIAGVGDGEQLFDSVLEFDLRDPVAALAELFPEGGPRDFRHFSSALYPLHLQFFAEQELVVRLKYRADRFGREAAERLLDHFINILCAMAREPWLRVKELEFLPAADRAACRWPGPQRLASAGRAATIHGRFEDCVRRTPDAVAVACGEQRLTYAELDRAANRLARRLQAAGAGANRLIGLCMQRSIGQIVGILGILKSGAAYLPLDPAFPDARLRFLLDDADAGIVVADKHARDRFDSRTVIGPDDADELDDDAFESTGAAPDLAYVIHTSGSTGQPKGVMVTHHNVVRLFDACESWLNPGIGDVWTMFHSFAFDFSVWEMWGALFYGGRLEIVPHETARSPEAFYELLVERGVTVLNQTPSAFRQLIAVDNERRQALGSLRLVIFGGEQLDYASLADWVARHGDQRPQLVNMYGITETTVHVTYRPVLKRDVETANASLIGWPLPDLYVRLLDAHGRPVPPGARGEICVGGAGVSRGYLNRPELTAQRFIHDPYSADPDARLYRSGDFARLMPNGELCYLGRADDQVKIRGFRIDPGEIAATLRRMPGVAQAVVAARATRTGEKRLIAWYVPRDPEALTETALRDALARRLPAHMLPARLIAMHDLPVNANGKIDVKALPEPAACPVERIAEQRRPRDGCEARLAAIWASLLERDAIARDDDFFALGGDSVLALQVVTAARAAGMELSPRDLFRYPVLSELAARVEHNGSDTAGEAAGTAAVLAPMQRRFFARHLARPDHCNRAFLFSLPPDVDPPALERAFRAVVAHHEALHRRYLRDERGGWRSEPVEPHEALEFSCIELDHLDEHERREAIALITEDIHASLSLSAGLLVRAAHFSGGLDGDRLLIVIHELAADAASWPIILEDLDCAWRAIAAGRDPALKRAGSWSQWAARQTRVNDSHADGNSAAAETPRAVLADRIHTKATEREVRTRTLALDGASSAALLNDARHAYNASPQEMLLSALALATAAQWPHADRMHVEVVRDGRELDSDPALCRAVGCFGIPQQVLLELAVTKHPGQRILDTRHGLQHAPLAGAQAHAPIGLQWLGGIDRHLRQGSFLCLDEYAGAWRAPENRPAHPLDIDAMVRDERIELELRFDSTAFSDAEIDAFRAHLARALESLADHCRTCDRARRIPGDFPLAHVTQRELDEFPMPLDAASDILPLSPIQRLHHALAGTDRDVGFDHWVFRLRGALDRGAFARAWQEVVRRHDALRTLIVDRGLAEPHQVVLRDAPFRLRECDWRSLDQNTRRERLDALLDAERHRGIDLAAAPSMRATLIRCGDDEWILAWSHHQALVDGWSWPVLAAELGELHDAIVENRDPQLRAAGAYRDYLAWLARRDTEDYARFWREHLRVNPHDPAAARTLLAGNAPGAQSRVRQVVRAELDADVSRKLMQLARRLRLTPGVVFQAAWALLLAALLRRFDVTIGVAFSGRTAGIPVSANTIGPFVNDLPVRVHVPPTDRAQDWLAGLRETQADLNHYQNASPSEVCSWCGLPPGARLFDTLLVFQNYATGDAARRWGRRIAVESFEAGVRANYPLVVAVTPAASFRIDLHFDPAIFSAQAIDAMASSLAAVLRTLAATPDVRLSTILNHVNAAGPMLAAASADPAAARVADETDAVAVPAGGSAPALRDEVARICSEVLGLEPFDTRVNLFDAGAQSVSLIEIHRRVQRALGRSFPVATLFQYPTVDSLAAHLAGEEGDEQPLPPGRRAAQRRSALAARARIGRSAQTGRPEQ